MLVGSKDNGLYYSTDNGFIWQYQWPPPWGEMLNIWDMESIGPYVVVVVATRFGYVFRVPAGSDVWTQLKNGLTNSFIVTFATSGSVLYCAADRSGVFRTTNYSDVWEAVLSGLDVWALAARDSLVFAGTNFAGIFRLFSWGGLWSKTTAPVGDKQVWG